MGVDHGTYIRSTLIDTSMHGRFDGGRQVTGDAVQIEINHADLFRNQIHVWFSRRGDHQDRLTGYTHGDVSACAEQGSEIAMLAEPLAARDDIFPGLKVGGHGFSL